MFEFECFQLAQFTDIFGSIGFYTFVGFQSHIICNFWTYGLKDMKFISLQIFEIDLNLFRLWFDQGSTRGDFRLHGTVSAGSGFMAVGFKEIWMAWICWYRFT
jgi:hypothetical protein